MTPTVQPILYSIVLCLVQFVAALPWLFALDPLAFKGHLRTPLSWLKALGGVVAAGVVLGLVLSQIIQDRERLAFWGLPFGALLYAQLSIDLFVLAFTVLLLVWPKGGAVALAAFRESVRQPLFWLLAGIGLFLILLSPFIPYFTFGEDYKMVKELGYQLIMLLAALFAVLAASMSISDEIEGRTAITLMSKPVSRRQFLLGKYFGTLLAALLLSTLLGWVFDFVLWFKPIWDREPLPTSSWLEAFRQSLAGLGDITVNFLSGAAETFDIAVGALPGLVLGSCQVMVLLAIAVALATRLPFVVNLVTCLVVFALGHLTEVLVQVSEQRFALVNFIAQFFEVLLPGLQYFDLGSLLARDVPPPTPAFVTYIGSVAFYAVLYSAIALLFGLILFEDRDLA